MSGKVRRIDYYPDEYVSGVAGVLRADEQGVYWMVCSLIMSEGGPITRDDRRIAGLCASRPASIKHIVDRLVHLGKLTENDGKLSQKRAQSEVELASKRIQKASENGAKGGRPTRKDEGNQQKPKADGSSSEKLTTNYQLPTTNEDTEANASVVEAGEDQQAFDLWNAAAGRLGLPKANSLTPDRRRKLRLRLREHGIDGWSLALAALEHAPHCRGNNDRGWRADLDFLLNPSKLNRLMEGAYRRAPNGTGPPPRDPKNNFHHIAHNGLSHDDPSPDEDSYTGTILELVATRTA